MVAQAKEGNQEAFSKLYERYFKMVHKVCESISKNRDIADELTQEVFMKLQKRIQSFKGDSAFSTWLYRVASNEALMYLRTRSSKSSGMQVNLEEKMVKHILDSATNSGTDNQEENEIISKIARERAIKLLPPGYKKVYLLSEQGYGPEEIAKITNANTGTVKSQLAKARRRLRELLDLNK